MKKKKVRLLGPDGVIRPHPDPVRNGSVLPHLLGQLLLDHEGLVRRLRKPQLISSSSRIRYRSNTNHTHTERQMIYHFRCARSGPRGTSCRRKPYRLQETLIREISHFIVASFLLLFSFWVGRVGPFECSGY